MEKTCLLPPIKLLLLDDSEPMLGFIGALIRQMAGPSWGGQIFPVATLEKAVLLYQKQSPDLVLSDFYLGASLTAVDFFKLLESIAVPKKPKFMVMSADQLLETDLKRLEPFSAQFLKKPTIQNPREFIEGLFSPHLPKV